MKKPKYDKITNFTPNKDIFWIKINDAVHYKSIYNFLKHNKCSTQNIPNYNAPNNYTDFVLILDDYIYLYSKDSYNTSRYKNKPIKTLETLQNEIRQK